MKSTQIWKGQKEAQILKPATQQGPHAQASIDLSLQALTELLDFRHLVDEGLPHPVEAVRG